MTSTITLAAPTAALVFDEPTIFTDRSLETASWWDEYEIQPGSYEFEWVNISGTPWNANPQVVTNGFIGNIGPYYGKVTVTARMTRSYREARLLGEVRGETTTPQGSPKFHSLSRTLYAYQLPGWADVMETLRGKRERLGHPTEKFLGGRIVRI